MAGSGLYWSTIVTLVCVGQLVQAAPTQVNDDVWGSFKSKFGKEYKTEAEDSMRRELFAKRLAEIESHNNLYAKEIGYTKGVNHMTDWTDEEYKSLLGFRAADLDQSEHIVVDLATEYDKFVALTGIKETSSNLNDGDKYHVDWSMDRSRVTPVKNQAECGSCWAFGTTGLLEGQAYRFNPKGRKASVPLSEQQLLDCDKIDSACNGGLPLNALQYMMKEGVGLESEKTYGYIALDNLECEYNSHEVVSYTTKVNGTFVLKAAGNELALADALRQYGPIAIAIDATKTLMDYEGGILKDKECSSDPGDLNHAVLLVGYGSEVDESSQRKVPYWKIKNSWGANWGEKGYFRYARNAKNMCGVATYPMAVSFEE